MPCLYPGHSYQYSTSGNQHGSSVHSLCTRVGYRRRLQSDAKVYRVIFRHQESNVISRSECRRTLKLSWPREREKKNFYAHFISQPRGIYRFRLDSHKLVDDDHTDLEELQGRAVALFLYACEKIDVVVVSSSISIKRHKYEKYYQVPNAYQM